VRLTPHPLLVQSSRKNRAIPVQPPSPWGRTACSEPQCLYKGALYTFFTSVTFILSFILLTKL